MANETPSNLNLRTEYTTLTDKAFQFTLFRIPILLTITLLMYNLVNDAQFKHIMDKYKEVQDQSSISWEIPFANDWYVDHMFDDHGLSRADSIQYYRTIYWRESQIEDSYPTADSIFISVPRFFAPWNIQLHDDTTRPKISRYIEAVRKGIPGSKKRTFETWVTSFLQVYNTERNRDSVYWIKAYQLDAASSTKLHKTSGVDSNVVGFYYHLVNQHHDKSLISRTISTSELAMRNELFSLLGKPNPIDMNIARNKQLADLKYIRDNIAKSFGMKLPFLGDTPLNFQYWIFAVPLLMILSLMYLIILRSKIGIIEKLSQGTNSSNYPDDLRTGDGLTAYHQQPYQTFSKIFNYVELILWAISIYVFSYVLSNFHGFVSDIMKGAIISIYFALIYCHKIVLDLRRCSLNNPTHPILYRIWYAITRTFVKIFRYKTRQPLLIVGNLFIMLTLILTMCDGGCRSESGQNQKYYLPDGRVFTEEQVAQKIGLTKAIEGADLIVNYKKVVWDHGIGGTFPNRFFQICYTVIILATVLYLVLILIEKLFRKRVVTYQLKHSMLVLFSVMFIEYTICYATPFTELNTTVFVITLFSGVWLYRNRHSVSPNAYRISYRGMGQSLLMLILPFIVLCLINNWRQIVHFVPINLIGENKQLIFYGLPLTITGLLIALQTERQIVPEPIPMVEVIASPQQSRSSRWTKVWNTLTRMMRPLGNTWKYAFFIYLIILYVGIYVDYAWPQEGKAERHFQLLLYTVIYSIMGFFPYLHYFILSWVTVTVVAEGIKRPWLQRVICVAVGVILITIASRNVVSVISWHKLLCCAIVLLFWITFKEFPSRRTTIAVLSDVPIDDGQEQYVE
jgi:hypothetical protein